MEFSYKAINERGEHIEGVREADDKFELARHIKEDGHILVSAEPKRAGRNGFSKSFEIFFTRIAAQEKIIVAKNLSAMVKAGLSLARSLNILERQTKNPRLNLILREVGSDIQGGFALHAALLKHPKVFSPLFVSMVRAGEESGSLPQALDVIGSQLEKSYVLRKKIRGALIYPSIIIIAMIVVGVLMLMFVVPTLTATFKELNVALPASTQAIISVSDFLIKHTIAAMLSVVFFVGAVVAFFRTDFGKRMADYSILRIPIIGSLAKKINAARTTRTLASLLSSGVDVVEALSITTDVLQNSYYKDVLRGAEDKIQKGIPLSRVILGAEKLYPILVGEMIEVGEETGKLSDMLIQVASFYEGDVEEATKNMATIIEPFLMVVVGVVVGFFAISMISPTYSLLQGI